MPRMYSLAMSESFAARSSLPRPLFQMIGAKHELWNDRRRRCRARIRARARRIRPRLTSGNHWAMNPGDVIGFWFDEVSPEQWWSGSADFDAAVRTRFAAVHRAASVGELLAWRATPEGRLAEIIVLDQ